MKFLRYPGGKTKLLYFLADFLPKSTEIEGRYLEPFVGGGSIFLYIQPERAVISDLNKELIDLYKGIKYYPHKVWETFKNFAGGKEAYYTIRDGDYLTKHLYYRAARTLYLNRTCFKGMWRHNPKGNFNVGYGGEERRWAITYENILKLSKILKKTSILHSDFEQILDQIKSGDYIFLDPPYKPGEKQMFEAHYVNGRFSFTDQVRLSNKLKEISQKKNFSWMMTNSSHPDICNLYEHFNIKRMPKGVSGIIGVHTEESHEVVISNY
jgi:DNA adenine methylase